MEEKNRSRQRWLIPALLAVVVLLLAVILVFVMKPGAEPVDIQDGETPKLGYAEGTTVVEDPDALQKAVDEMYAHAAEGGVTLEYKNDARSTDGENFSCYIANAVENRYDMYLQIFADSELTTSRWSIRWTPAHIGYTWPLRKWKRTWRRYTPRSWSRWISP